MKEKVLYTDIDILSAKSNELIKISEKNLLALTLDEMKAIQVYYRKRGENPTDVELETIAQTWSEHCKHKTLRGLIEYTYFDEKTKKQKTKRIDNLLKQTIMKATKELDKSWCLSVFSDNAGIIEFDKNNGLAFKVETHNHPSALEPYGGAGTGIGGVIRDILGVGLGAKPIFNTDVFCFGKPDTKWSSLPKGVLHPMRVFKGVVAGVRDYGNRMGIPTINGTIIFDEGYVCNPLVYCGTAGIIPKKSIKKTVKPGDYILAIGGRTGRDGIHGATFSSIALDENTESSAVQIGNPIVEKKMMDTLLVARDKGLYRGITDCGAGGFSSAIGELGEDTGAEVFLDRVPLKYEGLKPWEIWVSEAQERMVLAVPPKHIDEIRKVFASEDVESVVLGRFTNTHKLVLWHEEDKVCELDMDFLHNGVPLFARKAKWKAITEKRALIPKNVDIEKTLHKMLAHPSVCSKEWVIRQYDHEVQGGSIIKPLQGSYDGGPGDASVVKPIENSFKGVAVSNGINAQYGAIDSYWMACANVDEALRNLVCVGGNLARAAVLDNFCWGDPHDPKELAGIVRASYGCYDSSKHFGIPFVSGKDSLNNTYLDRHGKKHSIPGTLLVSAVGVIDDVRKTTTMYFKNVGNLIYLVGNTKREFGGSLFAAIHNINDTTVPKVDFKTAKKTMDAVSKSIAKGFIRSCHDCSEGGLLTAIAEMAFSGDKGAAVFLNNILTPKNEKLSDIEMLFSETQTRFIVEVPLKHRKIFESTMKGIVCACIGEVVETKDLMVYGRDDEIVCKENISILRKFWKKEEW